MKLYIVADMEGICGVVSSSQVSGPDTWETEQVRRQFSEEVAAVCAGAIEAGVDEIVVNDFHGNGRNLLPERLPVQTMLVRGGFRVSSGFDMLDSTFGGLVILGAHARTGTRNCVLPHTYSERLHFELFGQPIAEFDLISLVAGEQKVPTLLISGDSKTIEQAQATLSAALTVVTKFPIGNTGILCMHPKQICEMLREETKRAIKSADSTEPPLISPPIPLVIRIRDIELGDRLDWIPSLKRLDDDTFEFVGESMLEIAKLVYGVTLLTTPGL